MKLPKNEDKYLMDGGGDIVVKSPIENPYTILKSAGYKCLDLYKKNISISEEVLNDFDPVDETDEIFLNSDKIFKSGYSYYYNIDLDFYINLKLSHNYINRYVDDDEELNQDGLIKISNIFYRNENIQNVLKYISEKLTYTNSSSNKVDIIVQNQYGFDFIEHSIKPLDIDIDKMYNSDFKPIYEHIVDKLNNSSKGVVILNGKKGTGKTNLLKHLTTKVNQKFIFVPTNMINTITSPSFIGDLIEHKGGGILVMEDCEQYIQDRGTSDNSIVSSLLQLTDGFLSDICNVKIILTHNQKNTIVDSALLRDGRLIAEYEFNELSSDKVEELTKGKYNKPMTLAEIYNNLTYKGNKKEDNKIGFVK